MIHVSPLDFGHLLLLVLEIPLEAAHELGLGVEDALEVGVRREDAVVFCTCGAAVGVRRRDDCCSDGAETKGD